MSAEVSITEVEAIHIGPDEALIMRLPEDTMPEQLDYLLDAMIDLGLAGRVLVYVGEAEFAVVKKPIALTPA